MHFYSLDKVISYNIPVNIIITERGYGKSFAVKEYVINKYLKKHESFMYIRRYENEIKSGELKLSNGKKEIVHRNGVTKAEKGHFAKAGVSSKRFVREFKFENADEYTLAQEIKADIFAAGEKVDATAISKGKGFQGAIKRHNQHRGPMTHGSKFHRHAGSNGAASDPSKVFKGKKMPGHMGSKRITIQNLEIVRVDAENNLILVKGSVPGPKKSLVTIKESVKAI